GTVAAGRRDRPRGRGQGAGRRDLHGDGSLPVPRPLRALIRYARRMRIEFTKMHGLGNDFVVFDAAAGAQPPSAAEFRRLADRHKGIGFDQALMLEPPRRDGTSVYYRIFNADGHEVEQCGNGARCIAALLVQQGRAAAGEVAMDSPGGLVRARVGTGGNVSVDMGVPDFTPASLPF